MASNRAHTTEIIFETDHAFIANLDNGKTRFGFKGLACKDVAPFEVPESFDSDDDFEDFISDLFEPPEV